ncbi:hypothetical protein S40285_05452 [Stachybotrys chlorohalonatus IBT 40285]|uniref:FAD/NAD(P)-binding domain-containing protein n=1 Tax=Stachybotrys chlorohalonatus (strain IBT 40285) TaxID=1283841 RepID=A0A084QYK4_STAC4|nr:hypothetical protein S40285_05452 [Stachybotrys chlorohalonata IBT 40285]
MSGNIQTVANIGAGLSGVVSAVHLLRAGMDVTVFERGDNVGGAWIYSAQPDRDPPFPDVHPPPPDWDELDRLGGALDPAAAARIFAPPGPAYDTMKSRGSEVIMRTSLRRWPDGLRAPLDPRDVVAYLRAIVDEHGVRDRIRFRTRVEAVRKDDGQWRVHTSWLTTTATSFARKHETAQAFDAVVVATGRYGPPRVPDVPGLSLWKARFPGRLTHAKQYRAAARYRGKTVLVIGAFISALEMAGELVQSGTARVYQSAYPTAIDFRDQVKHERAEKVAMVAEFGDPNDNGGSGGDGGLNNDCPIPAKVMLQDGHVLDGIHHVIFATGYLTSFPFLGPGLEQPHTAPHDADDRVVITGEARNVHNLHKDIFYIPDPSLAFIGVSQNASTFSLYDFQGQVLALVWAGRARLPPSEAMREEQRWRKSHQLPGTLLNSIFLLDDFVIRRLLDWVNHDLTKDGSDALSGPDPEWWSAFRSEREGARPLLGKLQDNYLRMCGMSWEGLQSIV